MLVKLSGSDHLREDGGVYPRPLSASQVEWSGDSITLAEELRRSVQGEVRFDQGSRALYATDGSNYRQVPIGVVLPLDSDDVIRTVEVCRHFGAPLLSRGCGTSLAGQCCNVAVVMDMSKYMHHVIGVDAEKKLGLVQPGCILDDLRNAANKRGLTFGPDPATHNHCTLGGMCGNNSCGIHAQMAGRTADNIHELEILTYDGLRMRVGKTSDDELGQIITAGGRRGEIYRKLRDLRDRYANLIRERYPKIPRRVSGYNLDELLPENGFHVARALVGSEGTCVTILEIVANLVWNPPARALLVLGYPDVFASGDDIPRVVAHKPIGCEGIDDRLIGYMHKKGVHVKDITLLPEGKGWLLVEFGAKTRQEAEEQAHRLMNDLKKSDHPPSMKLYDDPAQEKMLWEVRESGLDATAYVPGEHDTWPGWEDSAVPPDRVGVYLRGLKELFRKHGYDDPSVYGHFGQGCIHCRIPFDLRSPEGIHNYRSFMDDATTLVLSHGGSLSGEHGDGQCRAEYLPKMFGEEIVAAFREFKSIWDPDWKMNPGKVVTPYRIDENLRLGTGYAPPQPNTHFHFKEDQYSFSRATLRCVGVGECRREQGGTMCPSFMATREEMHSPRGRTHLLFEMLQGNPLDGGWKSEHVKEALDLCLSCKGCKGDCPVNVDVATYKSEFLSHYYEGRLQPRHAYASGLIHWWARIASKMPATVNFFTQTPGLSAIAKLAAGYSQRRHIPPFAPRTFKQWFRGRTSRNPHGRKVILWADTFNDHFTPKVARAAVDVLENAGFRVVVPEQDLCCGRPLYDYGMLPLAKKWLENIIGSLRKEIEQGTPIVGLEPSCISVFRDEMTDLLHGDEDAYRLKEQCYMLGEFLEHKAPGYQPPRLQRKAVVHGHCHHKTVLDFNSDANILRKAGLEINVLNSGCCGMAGAFGYEADHYDVSIKCGERVLLPAVREAASDAFIIADGFSCREQIEQETDRRALHLAQVLQIGLRETMLNADVQFLERELGEPDRTAPVPASVLVGAGALGLLMGGFALAKRRSGR
ncbi:MAG TPA: FAD-binding and (Fe-S)-binding domain-containing protein [Bryobacteraceae bacterium]|nr:FAD-binding and (Fe-S)-binding domain-containing protein [Bryobacteraceae bacterium]